MIKEYLFTSYRDSCTKSNQLHQVWYYGENPFKPYWKSPPVRPFGRVLQALGSAAVRLPDVPGWQFSPPPPSLTCPSVTRSARQISRRSRRFNNKIIDVVIGEMRWVTLHNSLSDKSTVWIPLSTFGGQARADWLTLLMLETGNGVWTSYGGEDEVNTPPPPMFDRTSWLQMTSIWKKWAKVHLKQK